MFLLQPNNVTQETNVDSQVQYWNSNYQETEAWGLSSKLA